MNEQGKLPRFTIWLREEKRARRVSLRHIARFAGLSTNTVKNLLDGVVERPAPETVAKLAQYFRVPRDELMALAGYVSARTVEERVAASLAGKTLEEKLAMLRERRPAALELLGREEIPDRATYEWIVTAILKDQLREELSRE